MSAISLSKLISTRKEELAKLLELKGTNFPAVERQNDLRISFIELELADLDDLNKQLQLNENQEKYLKQLQYNRERLGNAHDALFFGLVDYEKRWNLNDEDFAQVLKIFANLALEQEEE